MSINNTTREKLIMDYLPLVKKIVSKIAINLPDHIEKEDLINAGIVGLIQAIDRFDPEMGNTLATFASYRIKGSIIGELRELDILSRGDRKKVRELKQVKTYLEQSKSRQIEDYEIASELKITINELEDIKSMSDISFISVDQEDSPDSVDNLIGSYEHNELSTVNTLENKTELIKAINILPEKDRMIMSLYYVDELTLKEIGEVMNLTESRISQIHSKTINGLRKKLKHLI